MIKKLNLIKIIFLIISVILFNCLLAFAADDIRSDVPSIMKDPFITGTIFWYGLIICGLLIAPFFYLVHGKIAKKIIDGFPEKSQNLNNRVHLIILPLFISLNISFFLFFFLYVLGWFVYDYRWEKFINEVKPPFDDMLIAFVAWLFSQILGSLITCAVEKIFKKNI